MRSLVTFFLFSWILCPVYGQEHAAPRHVVYTIGISFQAVSTPLHKPLNNFRQMGFKLGAELPWNGKDNLRQSVELGYYFNRFNGRSIYLHSDVVYRPKIAGGLRADFHFGPGIGYILHPGQSLKIENGSWVRTNAGKLFPQVHSAFGLSYDHIKIQSMLWSPFIQYEVMAIGAYNKSIPALPTSFIHIGSHVKF